MDPLSLVRDFCVNKSLSKIRTVGDKVLFDGRYEFLKSTPTAFKVKERREGGEADVYCSLEAVLYVLEAKDVNQAEYLRTAREKNLTGLGFVDRKKLLDVLEGRTKLQLEPGALVDPLVFANQTQEQEGAEPATKRIRLDDDLPGAGAQRFQRQIRDRNTMLLAPTKDFKRVIDIANKAHIQLSSHLKQQQQQQQQAPPSKSKPSSGSQHSQHRPPAQKPPSQPPKPAAPAAAPVGAKPSGRFERDTTTEMLRGIAGEAGTRVHQIINMYGSHSQQPATQQPAGAAALPGPPPVTKPSMPPPPPSSASASKHHHSSSSQQHKHSSSSSSHKHAPSSSAAAHHSAKKPASTAPSAQPLPPIIVVPSAMTAMINMYNAAAFLEQGSYVSSQAAQEAAGGASKVSQVQILRRAGKPSDKPVPYIITDKPPDKKDTAAWSRVVAVIVTGAKWQFKEWPHKGAKDGDLVDTFHKVAGFFIHFADDKVPDTVANWNVKRLGLARERRHMDRPVMHEFFAHLDAFLAARKCSLAY